MKENEDKSFDKDLNSEDQSHFEDLAEEVIIFLLMIGPT